MEECFALFSSVLLLLLHLLLPFSVSTAPTLKSSYLFSPFSLHSLCGVFINDLPLPGTRLLSLRVYASLAVGTLDLFTVVTPSLLGALKQLCHQEPKTLARSAHFCLLFLSTIYPVGLFKAPLQIITSGQGSGEAGAIPGKEGEVFQTVRGLGWTRSSWSVASTTAAFVQVAALKHPRQYDALAIMGLIFPLQLNLLCILPTRS